MENFNSLLILMVTVLVAGKVFRLIKLPVIFGELIGGIIVGPMMLNLIDTSNEAIKMLADLGIFFLMLHSGLQADPDELLKASRKSILIAIGGVVLPFAGGYLVAKIFGLDTVASLFVAMCLSITAIAVSARLFKDYGISKTRTAQITMGAAIIDDILALILFSVIFSLHEQGEIAFVPIVILLLKIIFFFVVVIWGGLRVAPFLGKILSDKGFTFALIVALVLGLIAEWIGLHMIIGAFLAGLFIREEVLDKKIFNKIEDRIYGLSYSFLGPIFFASLAFHIDFSSIYTNPAFVIGIIITAILGKIVGAGLAALVQKINLHESYIIGLAMNSRGAVEMIIASIGLQSGIINREVFSVLIIMGFITTIFSIFAMKSAVKNSPKIQ